MLAGGLWNTFSGLWRVTQLGRCQLLALGWAEILQLTQAVLPRSPLPLVGALTPHSHRHPHMQLESSSRCPVEHQKVLSYPYEYVVHLCSLCCNSFCNGTRTGPCCLEFTFTNLVS